jgi:hypothetical protein
VPVAKRPKPDRITLPQLRRLHILWRQWSGHLRLDEARDRALRHYFVEILSGGRARETAELTREEARRVIGALGRLVRRAPGDARLAAGTAGRRGFAERPRVKPTAAAWRALWGTARALGMDRASLDAFVAARYRRFGLRGTADIRTMADLNRVLCGGRAVLLPRGPPPA